MNKQTCFLAFVVAVLLTLAGCGSATTPAPVPTSRVINITMVDNAYQPAQIYVRKGETAILHFANNGSVQHEAVIGNEQAQASHEAMAGMSGMDHGHSVNIVTVEPGASADLTYTFNEPTLIGCHEKGHWNGGMKLAVITT